MGRSSPSRTTGSRAEEPLTTLGDDWESRMRAVKSVKRRVAIVVAVAAIGMGASACFPNVTPGVGPSDPLKAEILNHMNYDRVVNGLEDSP